MDGFQSKRLPRMGLRYLPSFLNTKIVRKNLFFSDGNSTTGILQIQWIHGEACSDLFASPLIGCLSPTPRRSENRPTTLYTTEQVAVNNRIVHGPTRSRSEDTKTRREQRVYRVSTCCDMHHRGGYKYLFRNTCLSNKWVYKTTSFETTD